jgi:fibronectin-binding autotransporter adhesin
MVSEIGKVIRRAWGRPALVLALLLILLPQGAWANSATWLGTTTNYNLTTNWEETPPTVPGDGETGETASFTDTGAGAVNIGTATANAVGFSFSNEDYDYTITLADGVTQGLTGVTTTGSGNVTLAASGTGTYNLPSGLKLFTIGAGQTTTISGALSGTGTFEKLGDGTLILTGNNTYTGSTILVDGTLAVGNDSALGLGPLTINVETLEASGGAVTLNNYIFVESYATATIGGSAGNDLKLIHGIELFSDANLTVSSAANTTIIGIAGDGALTQSGTGTLTLSHNNTYYTGDTTLNGGTLLIGSSQALGGGDLTITGGTFGASAQGIAPTNSITVNGSFNMGTTAGNDLTLAQNLALGGNTITHTGMGNIAVVSGALTLSGDNTYSGGTILNGGTLAANNNAALGGGGLALNGGTLLNSSGGGVTLSNSITVGGAATIGGTSGNDLTLSGNVGLGTNTLIITNAADTTISTIISGVTGSIVQNSTGGTGTLTLSGDNTYSGGTTEAGDANALGTGLVTVNGGTLDITTAGLNATALAGTAGTVDLGSQTLALGNDGTARTYAGLITGTGDLTYNNTGGGSLTLSGANTYSGDTYLNGGTLAVGNDSALGTSGLYLHDGTTLLNRRGGAVTLDNAIYLDLT